MKTKFLKIIFLNLLFISSLFANSFEEDINKLKTNSLKAKQVVVNEITEKYIDDERTNTLFVSMIKGELFYTKKEGTFVTLEKKEGSIYFTKTFLTNEILEPAKKSMFKKVKTNNKLRSIIKTKLAEMNLNRKMWATMMMLS